MKVDLTEEEIQTILDCVRKGRDLNSGIVDRTTGDGKGSEYEKALDKLRRCHDVLRALESDGD